MCLILAVIFFVGISIKVKNIAMVYFFSDEVVEVISSEVLVSGCKSGSGKIGGNPSGVVDSVCYVPNIKYFSKKYGRDYVGSGVNFILWKNNTNKSMAYNMVDVYKEGSSHLAYFRLKGDGSVISFLNYSANWYGIFIVYSMSFVFMFVFFRINNIRS